jgi:hypothetical protein
MTITELKNHATKARTAYYESRLSGISFGNTTPADAAQALADSGTRASLKKDILAVQKKLLNAEKSASLLRISAPDNTADLVQNNLVKQRRLYGNEGLPKLDIDTTDHGNPKHLLLGGHAHDFVDGKRQPERALTEVERELNTDILESGKDE